MGMQKEAARWFAAAAEQGDADAQFQLGVCYHEGKVTQPATHHPAC
jgi:TPR repeat protein